MSEHPRSSNAGKSDVGNAIASSDVRQLCASYLDGTLEPELAAELETRFDEPAVAQALELEAAWLLRISDAIRQSSVAVVQPADTTAVAELAQRSNANHNPSPILRVAVVLASLAATLLVAFAINRHVPNSPSFELELARSLASPSMQWESEGVLFNEDLDTMQSELDGSEWEADDESLGWMLVAVE
ncbi:MAG: hypothetical protein AAF802_16055, partial [Planctomycetota bacterium]